MNYEVSDSNQNFRQQQKKPSYIFYHLIYPSKLTILIRKVNVENMHFSVSWPK